KRSPQVLEGTLFVLQSPLCLCHAPPGKEARPFLAQAGLAVQDLAAIWELADLDHDGRLTEPEFTLAMFLIQRKLAGQPIPTTLPASLVDSVLRPGGGNKRGAGGVAAEVKRMQR